MGALTTPDVLRVLDVALALAGGPVLLGALYLAGLALLSGRLRAPVRMVPRLKFVLLVPAHDEEAGIAQTVASLSQVDYPAALRRVVVVADNCTDRTAERARAAGATVWEREDAERRGKGYALELGFSRVLEEGWADAVAVVDADTLVAPNLLAAFAARLERGAHAVQAEYAVRNPGDSWRTRLMTLAFALFHDVRSRARERLGVSAGLRGNGMCFSRALLRAVPHQAYSLVEDVEYGVRLGRAGYRVHYAHEARVWGEMVSGERQSRSQRQRWEGGRSALARRLAPGLVRDALAHRDAMLLDLALDLLVPPLATLTLAAGAGTLLALGLGWALGALPLSLGVLGPTLPLLALYVLRGWRLAGLGARGLLDLGLAPAYVAWKLALAVRARAAHARNPAWVRTTRQGEPR